MGDKINEQIEFSLGSFSLSELDTYLSPVRACWVRNALDVLSSFYMYEALFGAERKRIGYCIIVTDSCMDKYAMLGYVYVDKAYRNIGIATKLCTMAFDEMQDMGYKYIMALSHRDNDDPSFLKGSGLNYIGTKTYLCYSKSKLLNSKAGQILDRLKSITEKVFKREELPFPVELKTRQKVMKKHFGIDILYHNDQLTRYYVDGEEVAGYISFTRAQDNSIMMIDYYVDKNVSNKYIIPGIIASLLLEERQSPEEMDIVLFAISDNNIKAMTEVFGSPDRTHIQDVYTNKEMIDNASRNTY